MSKVYIFGAGGHGAVVADICLACGYTIAGFIDDSPHSYGTIVLNWPVIGGREQLSRGACVVLGIGSNAVREELLRYAEESGWLLPPLVHPSATISPFASIGAGTVVMPHAVVNARACIGRGCILNTACSVDHDCTIGDAVHIAPGVRLAGDIRIGSQTLIGIGSCIHPGLTIGAEAIIGAGSVVVQDIPEKTLAYGCPARIQKTLCH